MTRHIERMAGLSSQVFAQAIQAIAIGCQSSQNRLVTTLPVTAVTLGQQNAIAPLTSAENIVVIVSTNGISYGA